MASSAPNGQSLSRPSDFLAQLSLQLRLFLSTELAGAMALLIATAVAVAWANSPWSDDYEALRQARWLVGVNHHWLSGTVVDAVNDGLLTLFFFVVGMEVRRELAIGELVDRRALVLPVLAGLGGVVAPVLIYLVLAPAGTSSAWGTVIGTDTAFLLGAVALVGPRSAAQLRLFLLTLTVVDDIVAVAVIAWAYSDGVDDGRLLAMLLCGAGLWTLGRLRVRRTGPYLLLASALWLATVEAGLHASVAGMAAGLLIPAHRPDAGAVRGAAEGFQAFRQSPMARSGTSARRRIHHSLSVNERLLALLHPWSSLVVVPLFALVNAGVDLRSGVLLDSLTSRLTWAVVVALVVGKFAGIGAVALLGRRLRWGSLPQGVGRGHVLGGAALAGTGFTVALLVISLSIDDPVLRNQATVGVLLAGLLSTLNGKVVFWGAARLGGNPQAELPMLLDRPVEVGVDHIRGPAHAPLTLVEYGDFECPFCAMATGVAAELREQFGDQLRYVFRHLPLTTIHPHAERAARAALAADRQGSFWPMHDLLFSRQDQLELDDLVRYAAELGLDLDAFSHDMDDVSIERRLGRDIASAQASGARGTPTFFVNGHRHVGPYDAVTLAARLIGRSESAAAT